MSLFFVFKQNQTNDGGGTDNFFGIKGVAHRIRNHITVVYSTNNSFISIERLTNKLWKNEILGMDFHFDLILVNSDVIYNNVIFLFLFSDCVHVRPCGH